MPPKAKSPYLRCTDGFMLPDRTVVKAGQVVDAGDRVVKAAPNNFEPMGDVVESATRAPNERRLLPRRNPDGVVLQSAAAKRNARRAGRRTAEPSANAENAGAEGADGADDGQENTAVEAEDGD